MYFPILSRLEECAANASQALYPSLWTRHLGTICPNVLAPTALRAPVIGRLSATDGVNAYPPVLSPLGRAIQIGTGGYIQWNQPASGDNPFKIDPPMTLSVVFRLPANTVDRYEFFFCTDRRAGFQGGKYAGIMILVNDDGIVVYQSDNTGTVLGHITGTKTVQLSAGERPIEGIWYHFVIRIPPGTIQGQDVDSDPDKHVRFWSRTIKLPLSYVSESATETVGTASLVHATVQHTTVGFQSTDAYDRRAGPYDLALWQLWTRMLSVAEINLLFSDPLAMLRRKRVVYGKPVTAAGRIVSLGGYYKTDTRAVMVG